MFFSPKIVWILLFKISKFIINIFSFLSAITFAKLTVIMLLPAPFGPEIEIISFSCLTIFLFKYLLFSFSNKLFFIFLFIFFDLFSSSIFLFSKIKFFKSFISCFNSSFSFSLFSFMNLINLFISILLW